MSSPLTSFFKKLAFLSDDDPVGHVQLGSLEDLQGQEDLLPIPKPNFPRPDVDLYAPTKLCPPRALAYDQYYPPEPVPSPKGRKFSPGGTFETRQVARFQQLDVQLAPYEGLADKLEEQRELVERLRNALKVAEAARLAATENLSKIERALKVAEKKSLFQSEVKYRQQLALAEVRMDAAKDALESAQVQAEIAQQQLTEPQMLLAELEAEGRKQKLLTDEQLLILESLYGGLDKGDERENAAEQEVNRLQQFGKQVEAALTEQKEAAAKMDSAVLNLERANLAVEKLNKQLALSEQQGMGPQFGWIHSGPLRDALRVFLAAVLEETQAALQLSPFMPLSRTQAAEPRYVEKLLAIPWEVMFQDASRDRREKELPMRLREVYRDLLESFQWQTRFVANVQADFDKNAAALAKARATLWEERVRLVYHGHEITPAPVSPTTPLPQSPTPAPAKQNLDKQKSWGRLARLISF